MRADSRADLARVANGVSLLYERVCYEPGGIPITSVPRTTWAVRAEGAKTPPDNLD